MKQLCSREMAELNRSYKEAEILYAKYAASCGVSTTTVCVLYSLYTSDAPCTQTQLAEDWGIPMQTVNSCLKAPEKSGAVRLDFAEGSRKSKHILLTGQGEALAQRIIAPLVRSENAAFGSLTPEEQQQLLSIMKKHNNLLPHYLFGSHTER